VVIGGGVFIRGSFRKQARAVRGAHDCDDVMKQFLKTIFRRKKSQGSSLLRHYLAFYNGRMDTIAGRYYYSGRDRETVR
jgi:hypothetical protein